jgi:general secretion pathway protein A
MGHIEVAETYFSDEPGPPQKKGPDTKLLHKSPKPYNTTSMDIPYVEYCGLTEKPFGLTPDPYFYFESGSFREATDHLRFFLDQKEGFALIYGDVGLGKTTISRIFLGSLDKSLYHTGLILNPIMDEAEFLRQVLKELAVPVLTTNREELLEDLRDFLLEEYREGKETVLIIDEAQLLSSQLFEFIRVLSNFETDKQKILHIILFAQPEVVARLSEPAMRYLAQRITVIYRLRALSEDEIFLYINHRLLRAGSKGFVQFTDDAVKEIYLTSQGCPRIINVICDRCLLYLYSQSKRIVDGAVVRSVLKEESQTLMQKKTKHRLRAVYAIAACIALFLLAILFKSYLAPIYKLFHL